MKTLWSMAVALTVLVIPGPAVSEANYPERAIRILVGFTPGGPPDISARILAERFSSTWAKSVVVENAAGSGGNVAIERAIKSPPDGYTLVMASNSIVINPNLNKTMPFDAIRDLMPISLVVMMPNILVVSHSVPAKTVQELAALARAQPGKVRFGHAGLGTPSQLIGEMFKTATGVELQQQVSYDGIPSLVPDLIEGRISMAFPNLGAVLPLVREGKLRALAVTSRRRAPALSDVPTMADAGFPSIDSEAWFGLMAPAGTSTAIIDRLHRESVRVLAQNDVRKLLEDRGMLVVANSPIEFAALIKSDAARWARLIKGAGIKRGE